MKIAQTIKPTIDSISQGLRELIGNKLSRYVNEKAYSECVIQEGYYEYLRIEFKGQKISYFLSDFSWKSTPDHTKVYTGIDSFSQDELIAEVIPVIKASLSEIFFDKNIEPMFCYQLSIVLVFDCKSHFHKQIISLENQERKVELQERMNTYIDKVIIQMNLAIDNQREATVFSKHLLDFKLMNISPLRVIEIIEQILNTTLSDVRNKSLANSFRSSLFHQLRCWVEQSFKPLYFDLKSSGFSKTYILKQDFDHNTVDRDQLALYVYDSYLRIKYKDFANLALAEMEIASKYFGSIRAKQYLEVGTGTLPESLIHYKDKDLVCKANDVLARITIVIKKEDAATYLKALYFIINLLEADFPVSYAIKLSSKSGKKFLPVKGLAKSSTNRFFTNCLHYPELYTILEQYANLAMKEFEWYNDVEPGDKSCLPGSYAVFGLSLVSEAYFPLLKDYFKILDDEHQMVHQYFIDNLIESYGITKPSLEVIACGILSAQFDRVYKSLAILMREQSNQQLLLEYSKDKAKHELEQLYYAIWGKNYKELIYKLDSSLSVDLLDNLHKSK